ncbi:MAG: hypothetical protein HN729_10990 [Candidatus Marinimicrobia bacterium]|nr:hypothetical protein [Candidatus Neomarinimicrobiota bacterium]MBT3634297.1 hypothetical protein [Candidatus Neomarinimicrobiota bacterium]MBT3682904.1 hypothetical protein [Candidatus Neomarinimicrobiota bacterium]MBT3760106.1 hypothetical protein [Candidatus Neomarinimicrobiota bacterium]MBT3896127.1 hypothetical protein [Candidatus Neomarinimicrobiota bacterium]
MNDLGFVFKISKSNNVQITHHGKLATTLRGSKAVSFIENMSGTDFIDQQQLMARLTGNYKRGNEKTAKTHPRNR